MIGGPLIIGMVRLGLRVANHVSLGLLGSQVPLIVDKVYAVHRLLTTTIIVVAKVDGRPSVGRVNGRIWMELAVGVGQAGVNRPLGGGPVKLPNTAVRGVCLIGPVEVRGRVEIAGKKDGDFVGVVEGVRHSADNFFNLSDMTGPLLSVHHGVGIFSVEARIIRPIGISVRVAVVKDDLIIVAVESDSHSNTGFGDCAVLF